jgi:preprotein translocase subunit SecA
MAVPVIGSVMKKVFGTRNERMVKHYLNRVEKVNAFEEDVRRLTDAELREKTEEFRKRSKAGETGYDMLPEIFAIGREAMDRSVGIRNIFNPEHGFDPSTLSEPVQKLYAETKAKMDATPDQDPTGALRGCTTPTSGWQLVDIPNEIYEAVRTLYPLSKPPFRARPFDVQLIGGIVLSQGKIAEMKTGEGKTIVAPLASYLACVENKQVHVITVNDYLVQRDRDWVFPFYRALGLTIGAIHPQHMQSPQEKSTAYSCDALYGTTSEFGFDYLRDNMKLRAEEQFQKEHAFAIVDEVDSTLIDEARTPLIISGLAHQSEPRYALADQLSRHLVTMQKDWDSANDRAESCVLSIAGIEGDIRTAADKSEIPAMKVKLDERRKQLPTFEAERDRFTQYYEVELDKKKATVTDEGIAEAQRKAGVGSFYVGEHVDMPHLLEQSIRAHTVYQRDRDYMVAPDDKGEETVVIVDQNTGRKMVGRQWSDGLHQAVEAKEGVQIKEETQTMATITIQNYFKMYERLAGMTGTADTEATEFHEIYSLDVISIPTNVPIQRSDRNDWVYPTTKGKWSAIVQEIRRYHDVGRPVLVGTTSVEKSEELSHMLSRETQIQHEVLNAKQHEREADIVLNAGQVGAVMIATNMAGRGTDIKLGKVTRDSLIDHWKRRDICPREVDASMDDEEILTAVYRHLSIRRCDVKKADAANMDLGAARRTLMLSIADELSDRGLGLRIPKQPNDPKALAEWDAELAAALDDSGMPPLHRLQMWDSVEPMGGLHIVGTERHESRRIDNQLRGRAGRQGDFGSSRFFLSLEDDLMKMFAGKIINSILSRSGFKEGVVLEAGMLTKSVARAQRKVEERNFQWRKNILEYDEPMEHQRRSFYGTRQPILEGAGIRQVIFEKIEGSVYENVETYLGPDHVGNCMSEWVSEHFNIIIAPERFRRKDREDVQRLIRADVMEEAASEIGITATEYMPDESQPNEIDWSGLAKWCNDTYASDLSAEDLDSMNRRDVINRFVTAAQTKFDGISLAPIDKFLVSDYSYKELAEWSNRKFMTKLEAKDFLDIEKRGDVVPVIMDAAEKSYKERERIYSIDHVLEMTTSKLQQDPAQAVSTFTDWVNARYDLNWSANSLPSNNPQELRTILVEQASKWDEKRIAERARKALDSTSDVESLDDWLQENARIMLTPEEKEQAETDRKAVAEDALTRGMRQELTTFERWILLQILDASWKDHLHQMDQLRDAIGFRSFSQRDPRIEFKREAAEYFDEMQSTIQDKVTDVIMRGRLSPQATPSPQSMLQAAARAEAEGKDIPPELAAALAQAKARQQQALESGGGASQPTGSPGTETAAPATRSRPAAAAPATAAVGARTTPRRGKESGGRSVAPTIGRNELVTVMDPKTGKKEEMKFKKAKPLLEEGWRLVNR